MRRAALILALTASCARAPGEAAPAGSAQPPASTFSREAFAPRASDAGAELPVPTAADPAALDEILAAAPRLAPRASTGPDGGSAIGAETRLRDDAPAADPSATPGKREGAVRVGRPLIEPDVSANAIEQAARAQIYWNLTQRCRDAEGKILPPETVRLIFQLDPDGYLLPPSVLAVPKEDRFAAAARCMARELGASTFRAPAAARGRPHVITSDVPSVD